MQDLVFHPASIARWPIVGTQAVLLVHNGTHEQILARLDFVPGHSANSRPEIQLMIVSIPTRSAAPVLGPPPAPSCAKCNPPPRPPCKCAWNDLLRYGCKCGGS